MADGDEVGLGRQLAEAREILVGVHGRLPHARALREHLQRAAAEVGRPPDRLVDPAGARDMGSQQHGRKPIRAEGSSPRLQARQARGQPCPHAVCAVANRFAPRGRRAHGPLLVALRAAPRRPLRAAHRGHRRDARAPRGDRADPALAALGRARVGRGPGRRRRARAVRAERAAAAPPRGRRAVPGGGPRLPLLLHDRGARRRARGGAARGTAVHLLAPLPCAERRGARRARGRGRPVGDPLPHARRGRVRRPRPRPRRRCASSSRSSATT